MSSKYGFATYLEVRGVAPSLLNNTSQIEIEDKISDIEILIITKLKTRYKMPPTVIPDDINLATKWWTAKILIFTKFLGQVNYKSLVESFNRDFKEMAQDIIQEIKCGSYTNPDLESQNISETDYDFFGYPEDDTQDKIISNIINEVNSFY